MAYSREKRAYARGVIATAVWYTEDNQKRGNVWRRQEISGLVFGLLQL